MLSNLHFKILFQFLGKKNHIPMQCCDEGTEKNPTQTHGCFNIQYSFYSPSSRKVFKGIIFCFYLFLFLLDVLLHFLSCSMLTVQVYRCGARPGCPVCQNPASL
ncbi:unnamed protein product [Ilex paraguariensis]|uniref:Uncharacterized protein n=1 Tax=Ilex paraguariensis TaxID=185542 RepID=A0ABC8SDV7_9AQUA